MDLESVFLLLAFVVGVPTCWPFLKETFSGKPVLYKIGPLRMTGAAVVYILVFFGLAAEVPTEDGPILWAYTGLLGISFLGAMVSVLVAIVLLICGLCTGKWGFEPKNR